MADADEMSGKEFSFACGDINTIGQCSCILFGCPADLVLS